ncbi:hypothetical protein [Nocardia mexicana]|uniref:Uncharacterized protein n=1 Tax=Nocardia mexicana TaxID=279262 RepID=A0A370GID5_9NOCA|nr:hypothetical protein [Nocardia mexicana]RDI43568.1 hypothetical protein DFR68_12035 [Nocardia mexicana]
MNLVEAPIGYANPDFYPDHDSRVRQLRADFAKYYQLQEIAPHALDEDTRTQYLAHAEGLAMRWGRHEQERFRRMWQARQAGVMGWQSGPQRARRIFDELARSREAGELPVDDELWDALVDARHVTGHGDGVVLASAQDADHRYPNLLPDTYTAATRDRPLAALLNPPEPDPRTAVERSLGAPRTGVSAATEKETDRVIAATDAALEAEEQAADLDTGYETRRMLLPREIRDAPITYRYTDTATWETRHAQLLRQVQDLAAEHANNTFDHHDSDHAVIHRLETLRQATSDAGRAALRAGIVYDDVERAYQAGRDGIYWSTEPSHARLGRLAQLTEQRDHALADAAALRHQIDTTHPEYGTAVDTGTDTGTTASAGRAQDSGEPVRTGAGADIGDAIGAALPEIADTSWAAAEPDAHAHSGPAPTAGPDMEVPP